MFEDTIRVIRSAVNERRTDNTMTKRKKDTKDYNSWRNAKYKTTESMITNNEGMGL